MTPGFLPFSARNLAAARWLASAPAVAALRDQLLDGALVSIRERGLAAECIANALPRAAVFIESAVTPLFFSCVPIETPRL